MSLCEIGLEIPVNNIEEGLFRSQRIVDFEISGKFVRSCIDVSDLTKDKKICLNVDRCLTEEIVVNIPGELISGSRYMTVPTTTVREWICYYPKKQSERRFSLKILS